MALQDLPGIYEYVRSDANSNF